MNKELIERTKPDISIIIPVYNAEQYLRECLDSIINQTFKNFEVLCVNDGSNDNSLDILSEYAAKDKRIKLFSQENSGPAQARNVGLANAKGEYIMFCDADDSYEPAMCEEMYKTITEQDVDIAMCNTNWYNRQFNKINNRYCFLIPEGYSKIDNTIKQKMNVYLWNKIFKKDIILKYNIDFPVGHKSDDNIFVFKYITVIKNAYLLNLKLYNHYDRENSIMSLYKSDRIKYCDLSDKIFILNDLYNFLIETDSLNENLKFFQFTVFNELFYAWLNVPIIWENRFLEEFSEFLNRLNIYPYNEKFIPNTILKFIKNKNFNFARLNLDICLKFAHKTRSKYCVQEDLYPIYDTNNIPIIFNCDNNFVKYLSVTLQSIIENSSVKNQYDIVILNNNISTENQNLLNYMIKNHKNFSIRYYNMENLIKNYDILSWFTTNHLNHTAYYRIFIPLIFKNYEKIIYLDSDLIINDDIANLYNQDLYNYTVGAVKDFCISNIDEKDEISQPFNGLYKYLTDTLNIENINNYFNSGVLLFDIKSLISKNYFEKFIEIGKINNRFFHDQNILNSVLQNDIKFLNPEWNIQLNGGISYIFETFNYKDAKIFHFCSQVKPWNHYSQDEPEILWWHYARNTPFYEELVNLKNSQKIDKYKNEMNWYRADLRGMIQEIGMKDKNKFNYYRTKILSYLTFGKTKKHYKAKKLNLKQHLRNVKNILKG